MHQPLLAPAGFAAPAVRVALVRGFPEEIDALAIGPSAFLRAAWYRAGGGSAGSTLVATRADGSLLAAIPLAHKGPRIAGIRGVPGSYWPFRSIQISPDADCAELAAVFAHPGAQRALAPVWRMGPVPEDERVTRMVMTASALAGWTVLTRRLGQTWRFDLAGAAACAGGVWPRKSTRKRLSGYERQLEELGRVSWHTVTGPDWSPEVLAQLGRIEADSWVGRRTSGTGAKFLTASQRRLWAGAMADPVIARALSATLLRLDDRPIAFSFDLRADERQYAIAGSYAEDMADFRVGKMVCYRQLQQALADGVREVDLGSGDSGYKREMGAVCGPALVDLLIVRRRKAAMLAARGWGSEPPELRALTLASPHLANQPFPSLRELAAAAALAGSAIAVAE